MMKITRILCPFLLFLQSTTEGDQVLSTTNTDLTTSNQGGNTTFTDRPDLMATYSQNPAVGFNATGGDCLIDTEMGLIAIASAGGLILCLLVTTSVLACQICVLQRRVYIPRTRRSNTGVSGTQYWGTYQTEMEGLVGPCDTSVMLDEVKTERNTKAEVQEVTEEAGAALEGKTASTRPDEKVFQIQDLSCKDSYLELPKDLEDMPLVV